MTNSSETPSASTPATRYRVRVLLVDDQLMIVEAIRRMLAPHPDIEFHYVTDPAAAVDAAAQLAPTVILQDLVMPMTDGFALVRAYRTHPTLEQVPVVVLSVRDDPKLKAHAFTVGANDYLVKLPDAIELVARIRYHSRSYLNQQQRDEAYRALRSSQQKLLETNLELQRLTNSDGLTGLANRRYFDEYLGAEWKRGQREQSRLGLLMIDVDAFKAYNDNYGHVAGDDVLRRVAAVIQANCARPADLAARFGGEEFAMILPSMSPGGLRLLAEKVRRSIESMQIEHVGSGVTPYVTVSIGAAVLVPGHDGLASQLVEAADASLYQAKRNGRNQIMVG